MVLSTDSVLDRILSSVQESPAPGGHRFRFKAMGTWCQVVYAAPSQAAGDYFQGEMLQWLAAFEARYSRFLPDSLISRINAAAGREWVEIDPETEGLLALCQEMHFLTRGAFDPTTLPLLRLWNWKADPPAIPADAEVQAARELVGWNKVQRRKGAVFLPRAGMGLDFGGIGKEYAVDRVAQLAQEHGLKSGLVDFGQDIRAWGQPANQQVWHVGLENPKSPGTCWAGVAVQDMAVATSGDYFRCFLSQGRRYGHILDPRSGYPVDNGCRAVTVLAPACTFAGILSTSAFILGPQEGLRMIDSSVGAAGCIITETSRYESRQFNRYVTHHTQTRVA